jgi:hypothetical protein
MTYEARGWRFAKLRAFSAARNSYRSFGNGYLDQLLFVLFVYRNEGDRDAIATQ